MVEKTRHTRSTGNGEELHSLAHRPRISPWLLLLPLTFAGAARRKHSAVVASSTERENDMVSSVTKQPINTKAQPNLLFLLSL